MRNDRRVLLVTSIGACRTISMADKTSSEHIDGIVIRQANPDDVSNIAALFRYVYQQTSHPFTQDSTVSKSIIGNSNFWVLALSGEQLVACTAIVHHIWNQTYESGSSVTHPDWQASGIGRQLLIHASKWMLSQPNCEILYGVPRRFAMHYLFVKRFGYPYILVGHDGAMDYANGELEFHGLALMCHPERIVRRVQPDHLPKPFADSVDEQLLAHLSFETRQGAYPNDFIVGPNQQTALHATDGKTHVRLRLSGDDLGNTIYWDGLTSTTTSVDAAIYLAKLIASLGRVRFVRAYVLADKIEFAHLLKQQGFHLSAYLPGWYHAEGNRYDCFLLTRRTVNHTTNTNTNGFDALIEQVASWDAQLGVDQHE